MLDIPEVLIIVLTAVALLTWTNDKILRRKENPPASRSGRTLRRKF
ncbi:MAG TPA: hypothetical protein VG297_03110 [Bryobacteraceae bacterium]|jgi:hypothetical protein|nr:hypothetical protein [Bryobacteraceae bacterium]